MMTTTTQNRSTYKILRASCINVFKYGLLFFTLLTVPASAWSQSLEAFEQRVTEHTLKNGWKFILVERPVAPVFAFMTRVDVGSAQEGAGVTGLAHMFEHMAFKGTPRLGTKDYEKEKLALKQLEEAYLIYQQAKFDPQADPAHVAQLFNAFKDKQKAASQYVKKNEFGDIIEREGGVSLNAFTSADVTGYFYALPSNKVELFAYLESERFLEPVFREFYEERDVVMEERRMRTESRPVGRLLEQFTATSFTAHPYHHPVIGYASDIQSYTMTDARDFYRTYYVPTNMVTAIVGDIHPKTLIPLLEKYFGRIPAAPPSPKLRTVEPPSIAEKIITLQDPSQPFYLEGYHKPSITHEDQPVFDAIDDILTNGRTSRFYRSLVRDKKIAVAAGAYGAYPGEKYPHLWVAYAVPGRGVENVTIQQAIREELERLKNEDVTDEELSKFRTRAKANLIYSLKSNLGLAMSLTDYHTLFGDWRELFRYIERFDKVTKEDIRRVAKQTFHASNRVVAQIETAEPPSPATQTH
ncbi:pitrilysin family protein [Candidatus Nitronereus thalassa]|uniref:Pitrilysin family protein n=1 Tax=Candidatus Nitronereus thalassa TaxID=3020898 RepID=A0ABU3K4W2_9BACT|nr:pitrilysin family protein [Candidatus Nitronereus thalassa]MDT7041442.1 pitrilysin family protein [Candidatus Nitronereus thalassa]